MRGNVVDLAIGVIIGGAFGKIVDAFVTWIMNLILNPVLANAGVENLKNLPLGLGELVVAVVNFLVIALVIFVLIRILEKFLRKKEEEVAPAPDPVLESQARLTAAIERLTDSMERR